MTNLKLLPPVREKPSYYDAIEEEILRVFKREIFLPLVEELAKGDRRRIFENSEEDLIEAIRSGRLVFYRGEFRGALTAQLTRELKQLGAQWDPRQGSFRVPLAELPDEIRHAIETSNTYFEMRLRRLDSKLSQILPADFAGKFRMQSLFDATLWKIDEDFRRTLKGITVAPKLTAQERKRIADEYTQNLQLYIQDFAQKEVLELRRKIKSAAFAGNRYESAVKTIQKSYGVTERKAKFLARQETSLMMTKFKQVRYESAGIDEYIWTCVAGSAAHPVRPMHKRLDGKKFRWDNPPIVNEKGERKNPGQDYNCRCYSRPVVRFSAEERSPRNA